jgi:ribosome-associated toxin RatA of RatAB toxin-antitoxin module
MLRGVIVALTGVAIAYGGDAGWERIADRDGIVVERRLNEPPPMREIRALAHSPLPPAAIMATLWKHEEYTQFIPYLRRLDVLQDDGDSKLIYEQIKVPVVKDRDVTVRVTRTFFPETGTYELNSIAVPDQGPAESRNFVRVRTSVGHWQLTPAADGGTAVLYSNRTDAGGLVPEWIANAAQTTATTQFMRAILDRARARTP